MKRRTSNLLEGKKKKKSLFTHNVSPQHCQVQCKEDSCKGYRMEEWKWAVPWVFSPAFYFSAAIGPALACKHYNIRHLECQECLITVTSRRDNSTAINQQHNLWAFPLESSNAVTLWKGYYVQCSYRLFVYVLGQCRGNPCCQSKNQLLLLI